MYRVSIELYKQEWKFGRMRNAVGTRAASLQNRQISEASTIHESAREVRERARSAKPESSACSHTIVYDLPTVRLANGLCWLVTLHHVVLECFWGSYALHTDPIVRGNLVSVYVCHFGDEKTRDTKTSDR